MTAWELEQEWSEVKSSAEAVKQCRPRGSGSRRRQTQSEARSHQPIAIFLSIITSISLTLLPFALPPPPRLDGRKTATLGSQGRCSAVSRRWRNHCRSQRCQDADDACSLYEGELRLRLYAAVGQLAHHHRSLRHSHTLPSKAILTLNSSARSDPSSLVSSSGRRLAWPSSMAAQPSSLSTTKRTRTGSQKTCP